MKTLQEVPFAITISDKEGIILDMNDKSASTFEKYGGKALIGESLFECHPPKAAEKLKELLQTHTINAYTIEKNGVRKLIYQAPRFEEGAFVGYVELSLVLPDEMPNFIRKE